MFIDQINETSHFLKNLNRRAILGYCEHSEVKLLSRVRLLATPWTVAHQAPLSMGFTRH